ncbi:MAG: hypothetical protein JO280_16830 [Mycobacteriaceae bacterium]|nr:hypothetical protein [Mycobacteriaceae bacterium]
MTAAPITATPPIAAAVLADNAPHNTGPDFGKASPVGLLILVLLMIGTFVLIWSMNRHLKKLPDRFDRTNPEPDQAADEGTVGDAADSAADAEEPRHDPGG